MAANGSRLVSEPTPLSKAGCLDVGNDPLIAMTNLCARHAPPALPGAGPVSNGVRALEVVEADRLSLTESRRGQSREVSR
jgi:hypothetical protein